jgi:TonB family protein
LVASAAVQAGGVATFQATRPPERPFLILKLAGDGEGQVLVAEDGKSAPLVRCTQAHCRVQVDPGTRLRLVAIPGEDATFEGWHERPQRTPAVLRRWVGDPLGECVTDGLSSAELVARSLGGDALSCAVVVGDTVRLEAAFGTIPEEQEVAILEVPAAPGVETPPAEPAPIDAEKLEEKALEVAMVPPPPKPAVVPPPPPEEKVEERTEKKPPEPMPPNMRMVEVPDENEVEKPPDEATHLSDKNRDVAEETAATETNLEKEKKGESAPSIESPDTTSPEIGGPEDKIAQLETSEALTRRAEETDHSGKSDEAKGVIVGEGGDNGDDVGQQPDALAMRGIAGRGGLREHTKGKSGKKGRPGVRTQLAFEDYERIVGKEKADKERQVAARRMSAKKGRWEKKFQAIKSALENFTPDVRPGNQTALKTRANPFAVYVARMHRRIHELWGFGFLADLDSKPSNHELNDFELVVTIEMVINPDGSVHKSMIAKTSGNLMFDVAALDTVESAAPYEETPEAIRSVDERVYLRWAFYRNWRQCGTFNVEPYILTEIPGGAEPLAAEHTVAKKPAAPATPPSSIEDVKAQPKTSVKDDKALYAANLWVSGFATADIDKLVRFSVTPFVAGGQVAAQTSADLKDMYQGLIVESGALKDWALLTADEYAKRAGAPVELPEGGLLLVVRTAKESFAVVMTRTTSGEYRATQIAR